MLCLLELDVVIIEFSIIYLGICFLFNLRPFQVIFWRFVQIVGMGGEGRVWVGWEVAKVCQKLSREAPQWRHGHQSSP